MKAYCFHNFRLASLSEMPSMSTALALVRERRRETLASASLSLREALCVEGCKIREEKTAKEGQVELARHATYQPGSFLLRRKSSTGLLQTSPTIPSPPPPTHTHLSGSFSSNALYSSVAFR